jgi:hypothetical protein
MQRFFFVLFSISLISCPNIYNQVIKGTVIDAGSYKPIEFAVVYLSSTSLANYTDIDGNFELTIPNNIIKIGRAHV